jgi:4-oxalocrotonate tautomerase
MPLIDIQLIKGVFNDAQKREMIEKVTDTMVGIEGEAMRGVTWVRVQELASGEWAIGGKPLTTADVKGLQAQGH